MAWSVGCIVPLVELGTKVKVHEQKQCSYTAVSVCSEFILRITES